MTSVVQNDNEKRALAIIGSRGWLKKALDKRIRKKAEKLAARMNAEEIRGLRATIHQLQGAAADGDNLADDELRAEVARAKKEYDRLAFRLEQAKTLVADMRVQLAESQTVVFHAEAAKKRIADLQEQLKLTTNDLGEAREKLRKQKGIDGLNFSALMRANESRNQNHYHGCEEWTPTDWILAVLGEVGEAANLIKKRKRGDYVQALAIGRELADAVCYLDLLADCLELNLGACVRIKFNEVSERIGSEIRL